MIYQVTNDSLFIAACMLILVETQLRQRFKASKLSVVFLANCPGVVIKSQEAHDELCNQGRPNFLFNGALILQGLRKKGRFRLG